MTTSLLCGVQREIYTRVRQQLLRDLDRELHQLNPKPKSTRDWFGRKRNQAFREVLDDVQLNKLALKAKRHPPQSELRRHALGELIEALRLSGKLCRPHREKFSPAFYDLLYEEALMETWIYICRNIDKYDPQRGPLRTWVNFRLDKLVIECRRKFSNRNRKELPSLNDLERVAQPENRHLLSQRVREYIEEDPKNLFSKAHIRNRPDANFLTIALARFSGKTWEEISSELRITVSTLSSFFQRCCQKFAPQFQEDWQS